MKRNKFRIDFDSFKSLYEAVWLKINSVEIASEQKVTKKDFGANIFQVVKNQRPIIWFFLNETDTTDGIYLSRKYYSTPDKFGKIIFDPLVLYNMLVYLGYKTDASDKMLLEITDVKELKKTKAKIRDIVELQFDRFLKDQGLAVSKDFTNKSEETEPYSELRIEQKMALENISELKKIFTSEFFAYYDSLEKFYGGNELNNFFEETILFRSIKRLIDLRKKNRDKQITSDIFQQSFEIEFCNSIWEVFEKFDDKIDRYLIQGQDFYTPQALTSSIESLETNSTCLIISKERETFYSGDIHFHRFYDAILISWTSEFEEEENPEPEILNQITISYKELSRFSNVHTGFKTVFNKNTGSISIFPVGLKKCDAHIEILTADEKLEYCRRELKDIPPKISAYFVSPMTASDSGHPYPKLLFSIGKMFITPMPGFDGI